MFTLVVSSQVRTRFRCFLSAVSILICGIAGAAAPADQYESAPFTDSFSSTTTNILHELSQQNPAVQKHTIHDTADVDWAICAQRAGGTTFPYSLRFTDLRIPSNNSLTLDIFQDGIDKPATSTDYIHSYDRTYDVVWTGADDRDIYYCVRADGPVDTEIRYSVSFVKNTGK